MPLKDKWSISALSNAMERSVRSQAEPRCVKISNDKLMFNGFWRNGDKSNACIWLKKATWADAKTGDGGGCKEFAKTAFNLTLPEFMERFGHSSHTGPLTTIRASTKQIRKIQSVDDIWLKLVENNKWRHPNAAEHWLSKERGFDSPKESIGSGFSCLEGKDIALFDIQYQRFIKNRLSIGSQLIAPIRSVSSEKVQNLFFRTMPHVNKNEKSRLLPDCGGWNEKDGSPRGFGFPHLINDFSKLIICEGMADYFAVECLLAGVGDFLPIGAANASALKHWADWLSEAKYKGKVIILYQLDIGSDGKVSSQAIGQIKATEAFKTLLQNKISGSLFNWASLLRLIKAHEHKFNDIADIYKLFGNKNISDHFLTALKESN